jgi:hypothetical protein
VPAERAVRRARAAVTNQHRRRNAKFLNAQPTGLATTLQVGELFLAGRISNGLLESLRKLID